MVMIQHNGQHEQTEIRDIRIAFFNWMQNEINGPLYIPKTL